MAAVSEIWHHPSLGNTKWMEPEPDNSSSKDSQTKKQNRQQQQPACVASK